MTTKPGDKTFVKITNKDIYRQLISIKKLQQEMISHQKVTNGKVKLNKWMATTALSLIIIVVGFLIQHSI